MTEAGLDCSGGQLFQRHCDPSLAVPAICMGFGLFRKWQFCENLPESLNVAFDFRPLSQFFGHVPAEMKIIGCFVQVSATLFADTLNLPPRCAPPTGLPSKNK